MLEPKREREMRIFLTPEFDRTAAKQHVDDEQLCNAVKRAEAGHIDASLGGSLIKQRIPRPGEGRSRGFRAVVVHALGKRAVFAHLFPKSAKSNLSSVEQDEYVKFGKAVIGLSDSQLDALAAQRGWRELNCDEHQEEVSE